MSIKLKNSDGWKNLSSLKLKVGSNWRNVTKALLKTAAGWQLIFGPAGPSTTTAPYLSSDSAGNNRITEPIIYGTTFYGQRGEWDANGGIISSYTYKLDSVTSATIGQGTIANIISETSMGSTSISITPNSNAYDGKWMIFTVKATRSDNVFGADSTDNIETGTGYRIAVIKNNPVKATGTTPEIIGIVTSLPTTLYYSSYWNGAAAYLPDSTRNSVKWYTATSGAYTASNIATYGTEVTSGITTSTPSVVSSIYNVTSSLVTPSTIPAGTYYYAVDTQKNSGTDYNLGTGYGIAQFAVFGPVQTPPNPPTNLQRTLGNGSSKTFSWTAPTGGGTLSSYEYRYTSASGDSGWLSNNLSTSVSLTVLYGASNTFFVRSVGPTSNSSSVSTGSFTVPKITTAPYMLTRTSRAAEIDWASDDQSSWSLSLSPAGATSPYTGTTESLTTTPSTDLQPSTTYTPTLTITSSTGDTHTVAGTAFTTLVAVPNAPINLQRTLGNGSNKTFTWDAPTSGTAPTSYEYNLSGAGWVSTGLTRSVSFTTIAGQNLTFSVRSVGSSGIGGSVSTGQFTIPTAPTFATTLIASTSAKWEWTSTNQNTWSVSLSPSGATSPYTGTSETVTTTPSTDLQANTSYTPTLRVYSISGDYIDKAASAFTTLQAVPGAPTSLQRTLSGTSKTFSWSAPTTGGSVTSYEYQINNSGFISNGASTSVTLTCPTGANVFYVRAVGAGGTGTFTSISFTIPVINSGPTSSSVVYNGATISWTSTNQSSWSLTGVGSYSGTTQTSQSVSLSASTSYTPVLTIASSTGDTASSTGSQFTTPAAPPSISGISVSSTTTAPGSASSISLSSATSNIGTASWTNGSNTSFANLFSVSGSGSGGAGVDPTSLATSGTFSILSTGTASVVIRAINNNKTVNTTWTQSGAQSYSISWTISGLGSGTSTGNSSATNPSVLMLSDTVARTVTINSITVYAGLNQTGTSTTLSSGTSVTAANNSTNSSGSGSVTYTSPVVTPVNTSIPTTSGSLSVGSVVTFGVGSWSNSPTSYDLRLYRGTAGVIMSETLVKSAGNVTSSTYTITSADFSSGQLYLRAYASATNAGGTSAFAAGQEIGPITSGGGGAIPVLISLTGNNSLPFGGTFSWSFSNSPTAYSVFVTGPTGTVYTTSNAYTYTGTTFRPGYDGTGWQGAGNYTIYISARNAAGNSLVASLTTAMT